MNLVPKNITDCFTSFAMTRLYWGLRVEGRRMEGGEPPSILLPSTNIKNITSLRPRGTKWEAICYNLDKDFTPVFTFFLLKNIEL